jgi:RND family efflux transporter MFP subunit
LQDGRETALRTIFKYILPLGLVVLSAAVVYGLVQIAKNKRPERKAVETQAMLVDAIPVEMTSLKLSVFSQGSVKPRTETTVVAEVSGKIVDVSPNFIAGGFFRDGEVLLQIDPSDYEAALKRAQANLASRKAQYADQKARSEQAMKDWTNLGRQGTPSDLTLRKPQLAEAMANVQAAEADLQKAQRDLQRTRISVPYDGLVRSKKSDIGQYVAPGTTLGVTFAIDSAELRLPLSATDVSFLDLPSSTNPENKPFPRVSLRSDTAGISGEWQAEIIRTEGVVDVKSRVTYAVARVIDPYGVLGLSSQSELRVGTFVRAEIEGIQVDDVIVLPRAVLSTSNTVLVANDKNELEIRPVSVIRAEPRRVYISDGLKSGEWVITTLLDAPIPGTLVTVNGRDKPSSGLDSGDDSVAASVGTEQ